MQTKRKIVLASKSPRRKRLLKLLGLKFSVRESDYEEDMSVSRDPYKLAQFLALEKARSVARYYDNAIIIAADSFIIFNGEFIGKPKNAKAAKQMLKDFSGKEHKGITGFALVDTKNNKTITDYGETKVKFRKLDDKEIDDYVATGEPLDMAGAYGLNDGGAFLIESVSGDYYSIIGLPLAKVYLALKQMKAI